MLRRPSRRQRGLYGVRASPLGGAGPKGPHALSTVWGFPAGCWARPPGLEGACCPPPGHPRRSLCVCCARLTQRPRALERRPCVAASRFPAAALHACRGIGCCGASCATSSMWPSGTECSGAPWRAPRRVLVCGPGVPAFLRRAPRRVPPRTSGSGAGCRSGWRAMVGPADCRGAPLLLVRGLAPPTTCATCWSGAIGTWSSARTTLVASSRQRWRSS